METQGQDIGQGVGKSNMWDDFKKTLDQKDVIVEGLRKKYMDNAKVLEGLFVLDGDFADVEQMIAGLDEDGDKQSVDGLRNELEIHKAKYLEFLGKVDGIRGNENQKRDEFEALENEIFTLISEVEAKIKENDKLEENIKSYKSSQCLDEKLKDNERQTVIKLKYDIDVKEKEIRLMNEKILKEEGKIDEISKEIERLEEIKRNKELEIKILEKKEQTEQKNFEDIRDQLEILKKENERKEFLAGREKNMPRAYEETDSRRIKKLILPDGPETSKDNNISALFLIAIVVLLLVCIQKL